MGKTRILEINLDALTTNPDQPRKHFAGEDISELAQSIDDHGLISPIAVKDNGDKTYTIVAGERRYRAFQKLKKKTISAIITTGNAEEISLIENVQRVNLHPLEEAEAYSHMIEKHGYSHSDLSRVVSKNRSTITKHLQLTKLPARIKAEALRDPDISKSLLLELVQMPEDEQLKAWREIKAGKRMTVHSARRRRGTPSSRPPMRGVLRAGRSFLKRLSELPLEEISESEEYLDLLKLHEGIASRMREIQESGS